MGNLQSVEKEGTLKVQRRYVVTQHNEQEPQLLQTSELRRVQILRKRGKRYYLKIYRHIPTDNFWPRKHLTIKLRKYGLNYYVGKEENQVILVLRDQPDLVMVINSQQDRDHWLQCLQKIIKCKDRITGTDQSTGMIENDISAKAGVPGDSTSGQPGNSVTEDSRKRTVEQTSLSKDESEFLNSWFPDLDNKSYIIPVTHFDHILADTKDIGGVPIAKLTSKEAFANPEIKERDETHKKVHTLFTRIKDLTATEEVMVMMTQASFSMYSNLVTAVSDLGNVTTTKDVSFDQIKYHKHKHSDLVIVNKQSGVLVGVAQSVHFANLQLAIEKVAESVTYLTAAASKIKELLKTVSEADNVAVHTTLVLTNITKKNFGKLQMQKAVQSVSCLCQDEMETDEGLKQWWQDCWSNRHLNLTRDVYRLLVAKFAIPATMVEIFLTTQPRLQLKHERDVVHAVGGVHGAEVFQAGLHQLSLFPTQAELLDFDFLDSCGEDVKFLWGPPGTGKTILLVLRALQWVKHLRAQHIFILQTNKDGNAASCLVEYQLQETLKAQQQRAQQSSTDTQSAQCTFTHVDMSELKALEKNKAADTYKVVLKEGWKEKLYTALGLQQRGQSDTAIYIVADEADGDMIAVVYQWLKEEVVTTVRLWAAGVMAFRDKENIPVSLKHAVRLVTEPLRCPGPVVQEVKKANQMEGKTVPPYDVGWQLTGEPDVVLLRHNLWGHDEHTGDNPWRCGQCNKNIISKLKSLHIGDAAEGGQGLSANDVFILGSDMHNDEPAGHKSSPALLINVLEDSGYKVRTLSSKSTRDEVMAVVKRDVTPPAITVANEYYVWGLERKIVVYCDSGVGDAAVAGRLRAFSRSTSLLIHIKTD